jgi:uncharacterized membrane protein
MVTTKLTMSSTETLHQTNVSLLSDHTRLLTASIDILLVDMMFSLADIWNLSISQAPELSNLLQAFTNVQVCFSHLILYRTS